MKFMSHRIESLLLFSLILFLVSCNAPEKADPSKVEAKPILTKSNPYVPLDQSPMDMSYYPVDYPINKMNNALTAPLVARVIYSRPHKKDRVIFSSNPGSLCEYGKQWRLGANEASEIEFYKPVIVGGKNVAPGRYVIYCVPQADSWTIHFNSILNTWGLHIDTTKDVMQTQVPVKEQSPIVEDFTMFFEEAADGASLVMVWDNVRVEMPVLFM